MQEYLCMTLYSAALDSSSRGRETLLAQDYALNLALLLLYNSFLLLLLLDIVDNHFLLLLLHVSTRQQLDEALLLLRHRPADLLDGSEVVLGLVVEVEDLAHGVDFHLAGDPRVHAHVAEAGVEVSVFFV